MRNWGERGFLSRELGYISDRVFGMARFWSFKGKSQQANRLWVSIAALSPCCNRHTTSGTYHGDSDLQLERNLALEKRFQKGPTSCVLRVPFLLSEGA